MASTKSSEIRTFFLARELNLKPLGLITKFTNCRKMLTLVKESK